MSKRDSGISPQGKLAILGALFGIPILFVVFSQGLGRLIDIAPGIVLVMVILVCDVYSAHICSLLYEYYETDVPLWRWVPCVGEASLLTRKYRNKAFIFYIVALFAGIMSKLPYSILKIFGQLAIQAIPFYMMVIALIGLVGVQIVKGLGLIVIFTDIEGRWKESIRAKLGIISKYKLLLFIPFVRMIGLYALAKPLETLVVFNHSTVNEGAMDSLVDDDDDEYDY